MYQSVFVLAFILRKYNCVYVCMCACTWVFVCGKEGEAA